MYKGKAVLDHAMRKYTGRRCIAPLIINLGARQTLEVKFTPWPFSAGKHPVSIWNAGKMEWSVGSLL
jgi:hypothetical protein